jgi:hypothetical protein
MPFEVFPEATQIQTEQAYLKRDQRIGMGWPSPDNPKNIAEDEAPKTAHPPTGTLRPDQPCG